MDIFSILEIAAVVLGITSVYLTAKQKIGCWPTGIAMVILYVIVFFHAKLYSDMIENLIYIPLQIWGWYCWVYCGKKKNELPVTTLSNVWRVVVGLGIVAVSLGVGYLMGTYTDASLPFWDALTTVMSLTAQVIMSWKKIENWVLWIAVDVMALFIYTIKGLYMTTGLYAVFLGLAIMGLIEWLRSMKTAAA